MKIVRKFGQMFVKTHNYF